MDGPKMNICTIADSAYFPQVRVLYESLVQYERHFKLYVLCMDELLIEKLTKYQIKCVTPSDIGLRKMGQGKEKFFFATPTLIKYMLDDSSEDILYVDADSEFFGPTISHIYDLIGIASTLMVFHGYRDKLALCHLNNYGSFNVGFNMFRNDGISKIIVRDWIEDCKSYFKEKNSILGFFSDQIYLDTWLDRYGNFVKVVFNGGINISPRVIVKYGLRQHNNEYYCGDVLIRHIHYIDVRKKGKFWQSGFHNYLRITRNIEKKLVLQYIKKLEKYGFNGTEKLLSTKAVGVKLLFSKVLWTLNKGLIRR